MPPLLPAPDLMAGFALGYLLILLVPGPNMLALGALAGLRGMRGAMPLCLGMAVGAACLAAIICVALSPIAAGPEAALAGATALLITAALLLPRRAIESPSSGPGSRRETVGGCTAGFLTALTNPVTAGYFAAQIGGPLADKPLLPVLPVLVGGVAVLWFMACAGVLALPTPRRLLAARERQARIAAAAILAVLAAGRMAAAVQAG